MHRFFQLRATSEKGEKKKLHNELLLWVVFRTVRATKRLASE